MVMLRSGTRTKDKEGAGLAGSGGASNGSIQDVGSKKVEETGGSSGSSKVSLIFLYFYPKV